MGFVVLGSLDSDKCAKVYRDTTGFIADTVLDYDTVCVYFTSEIRAPNGSVITLTFNFVHLKPDHDMENVEVAVHCTL